MPVTLALALLYFTFTLLWQESEGEHVVIVIDSCLTMLATAVAVYTAIVNFMPNANIKIFHLKNKYKINPGL
jgi:hypothetical protein